MKRNNLDQYEMLDRAFDAEKNATRVIFADQEIKIDSEKIAQALRDGIKDIKIEQPGIIFPKSEIQVIEIPKYIPQIEYREIEKIVYVPQIEYKTIEIPVITEKVVGIEREIVVKEVQIEYVEKQNFKWLSIMSIANIIGILLIYLLRR